MNDGMRAKLLAPSLTERDLQSAIIETARLLGYRVAHFRAAKTSNGWRTPVEADGAGFPDLVLTGNGRVVFAEVKTDTGRLSEAQLGWLDALRGAGAETYVWRSAQWASGEIERVLRG